MNQGTSDTHQDDDMPEEINLDGKTWVRGKHTKDLQNGYTVTVHRKDGSTLVREVKIPVGWVALDPDVQQYFPDAESVNATLRSLIALIPHK